MCDLDHRDGSGACGCPRVRRRRDSGIRIETSHNTLLSKSADDNLNYGYWVIGRYNKLAFNSDLADRRTE